MSKKEERTKIVVKQGSLKVLKWDDGMFNEVGIKHIHKHLYNMFEDLFRSLERFDKLVGHSDFDKISELFNTTLKYMNKRHDGMLKDELTNYDNIMKGISSFIRISQRNLENEELDVKEYINTKYYKTSKAGIELAKLKGREKEYSRQTINNYIKAGKIKYIQKGKDREIGDGDLKRFFEKYGAKLPN